MLIRAKSRRATTVGRTETVPPFVRVGPRGLASIRRALGSHLPAAPARQDRGDGTLSSILHPRSSIPRPTFYYPHRTPNSTIRICRDLERRLSNSQKIFQIPRAFSRFVRARLLPRIAAGKTLLMHGRGKQFDLNDPIDQIVIACLCVAFLIIPIGIFCAATWQLKKGIGNTPRCPQCGAAQVKLGGVITANSKDWDISAPPGLKWRCQKCGAEFETRRGSAPPMES